MSIYDGKIELPPTPTTTLPKHYSPTREEILKALGAVSEIEYNKMWRSLDEKTKDINELVQKIHILNEQNTKQYNELCEEIKKNNILEKKLEIATKALKEYMTFCRHPAEEALKEMEKAE